MKQPLHSVSRLLLAAMVLALLAVCPAQSSTINGSAPDFALKSNGGNNLRLSEYRGKVVLINFWASWCGPCRQEFPHLDELHKRYESLGFTVLGVNVEEDPGKALQLLDDMQPSFPVVFDSTSTVSRLYDVVAMPSTVLVDRTGNMRYLHKGYKPGLEEVYLQQIRELIRE